MPEIGEIRYAKEIGKPHLRFRQYIWHACVDCGKERWVQLRNGEPAYNRCGSCTRKGPNNYNWKNGRRLFRGYVLVKITPDNPFYSMAEDPRVGEIREHRLIMAQHLKHLLESKEVVHHINGIKTDNRIDNLQLMTKQEHIRLHRPIRKYSMD